ncbi:hypothetical protein FIBSPDRAFT_897572 [Athelia psychrophila]|uniref:Pirin N-terminal domain-containing protein n=1 Tax=Athelia psychrophila TaxID=1759441 RepID=A0A166C153_9AGAM|nr:hypothetical protein FIBSPDRAFT_897572 [Fibularhizoctonia sp. CBS 109695]
MAGPFPGVACPRETKGTRLAVLLWILYCSSLVLYSARIRMGSSAEINIGISESRSNDSPGTTRILKRGDVQLISAGAGIYHSEKAQNKDVHLLEIWSSRALSNLAPSHFIRHFSDEEKMNEWVRIAAPVNANTPDVSSYQDAPSSARIRSAIAVYATMLASGVSRRRIFQLGSTKGYIHVIQTSGYNAGASKGAEIKLSGGDSGTTEVELREGDGAYVMLVPGSEFKVQNIGARVAEVLLFKME